jgi:hypothetical protein
MATVTQHQHMSWELLVSKLLRINGFWCRDANSCKANPKQQRQMRKLKRLKRARAKYDARLYDTSLRKAARAALLVPAARAMRNVRDETHTFHTAALSHLAKRAQSLGFTSADMNTTLKWIQNKAPIIIHVDLVEIGALLAKDTHYRNQFETQTSNGCLDNDLRTEWEANLFGHAYVDAIPFQRCKYGVINITNDPDGVQQARSYGKCYFELRGVRNRTTLAPSDSAELPISNVGTLDRCAHVLDEFSDEDLKAVVTVATQRTSHVSSKIADSYREVQIHGEVRLSRDIQRIVVHPSLKGGSYASMLKQLSQRCSAAIEYM